LWSIIQSRQPVAFVWGGDAIYADIEHPYDFSTFPPTPWRTECATPARVRKLYEDQRSIPHYKRLLQTNLTVFGTIDGKARRTIVFKLKHDNENCFSRSA
jgi:hypothetical protein